LIPALQITNPDQGKSRVEMTGEAMAQQICSGFQASLVELLSDD
jgi:hypothetical protein